MERKELESQDFGWFEVYYKEEADAVMDSLEARIKELETETFEQSKNFEGLLTLLDDSHNRIKELEETISNLENVGWVSVKDRMPDDAMRVIVNQNIYRLRLSSFEVQYVQEAMYKDGAFSNTLKKTLQNVSHWMPLPPPPTKEG